jgi:hypothetical protein
MFVFITIGEVGGKLFSVVSIGERLIENDSTLRVAPAPIEEM